MTTQNTDSAALTLIPSDDKTKVEIIPFGTDEKIQLNVTIVQKMVAVATRSGKQPDATQCIKFMMLCKARHLNPFEGDAYLLGYDTQAGPQFSLITAHQVFLKRAEASKGFDGILSGVIVQTKDGALLEREGDLTLNDEKLVGGWAKVFRKDLTHPFYRRLKLETFSTGRSRWEKDPAGMIVKCAEADALRSAFPTHLGGLYMSEEMAPIEAAATVTPIERAQIPNGESNPPALDKERRTPRAAKKAATVVTTTEPSSAEPTRREQIEARLKEEGYSEEEFVTMAVRNNWAETTAKAVSDIEETKLKVLLENWSAAKSEMDEARTANG